MIFYTVSFLKGSNIFIDQAVSHHCVVTLFKEETGIAMSGPG